MVGPPRKRLLAASSLDDHAAKEDAQVNQHEAEFSRLRAALGLMNKASTEDLENFKYGEDMPALDADKLTGLERKGNTDITSMDLAICRNADGAITSVDVVVARISTSRLAKVIPKCFDMGIRRRTHTKHYSRGGGVAMSEEELGHVRCHIESMVHPCVSMNGIIDWGVHEHDDHAKCFCANPLIFIFSNKEAAMRDLRSLGCDLEKDICTRDIYDLRELDITFLARRDAKGRAPTTAGQRTKILRGMQLSTLDEILKSRGCFSSSAAPGSKALNILRAAVKMATGDATSAGWMRTKEQIDGGPFNRLPAFGTADEADVFLLELDLARAGPSSKRILEFTFEHEKTRFMELPARMRVAFSANRAQYHGCTDFLNGLSRFAHVKEQSAQIVKLLRLASQEARVHKAAPPATECTYQVPVAVMPGKIGMTNITPSDGDESEEDDELPLGLASVIRDYSKAGRDISTCLVDFLEAEMPSWPADVQNCIYGLYSTEEHTEDGVSTKYPKMKSNSAFKSIAREARQSGWIMNDEVAGWFITAITGRRELRNWYDRLPRNDPRFEANEQHEAWLQTMIEVVVALVGHQA